MNDKPLCGFVNVAQDMRKQQREISEKQAWDVQIAADKILKSSSDIEDAIQSVFDHVSCELADILSAYHKNESRYQNKLCHAIETKNLHERIGKLIHQELVSQVKESCEADL